MGNYERKLECERGKERERESSITGFFLGFRSHVERDYFSIPRAFTVAASASITSFSTEGTLFLSPIRSSKPSKLGQSP